MIRVDLDHDVSLFDALHLVLDSLVSLAGAFIISTTEDEAFPVASRCDEHHMHNILALKGLVMRYLSYKVVIHIVFTLALIFVIFYEMVDQICRQIDLSTISRRINLLSSGIFTAKIIVIFECV